MSQPQISTEERLKAARKRFEELKRKNKIPLVRSSISEKTSANTENDDQNPSEKTSSEDLHTSDTKEQIAELSETIELQKGQIRKLRDENTELKLERMDLKDKVTELEKELAKLRVSPQTSVPPPSITQKELSAPIQAPVSHLSSPVKPLTIESPKKANTGDFREALLAWKGWQVDMRTWSGCQGAQAAL